MRVRFIVSTVLALGLGLGLALPIHSEEPAAAPPEAAKPGPEHAELAKLAGDWDVAIKEYQEEGKPAVESKGSATFKVILDGFFLQQDFTGTMMGTKYNGLGLDGYDQATKKYTSSWADSMGGFMKMEGESTDGGKTISYLCEMPGPGGAPMKMTMVHTRKSDDEFRFEIKFGEGKEAAPMVDMTYTRKKK